VRSLRLEFPESGEARLIPTEMVDGTLNAMQKASVNVVTRRGSDKNFPTRGTLIEQEAHSGGFLTEQSAAHSLNFAALETRQFIQQTLLSPVDPVDNPLKVLLALDTLTNGRAVTQLFIQMESGETLGTSLAPIN